MGKARQEGNANDPATGKPMPAGVTCRGPLQYRCRKMVDGARVTRTFETARLAREWLEATAVAERDGTFVDRAELSRWTVRNLVQKFVDERMQDGSRLRGGVRRPPRPRPGDSRRPDGGPEAEQADPDCRPRLS